MENQLQLITWTGEIQENLVIMRKGQVNRGGGGNTSDCPGQKERIVVTLGLKVVTCSVVLIHFI